MELLYISALSSERLINEIYNRTNENPGFAVQKFSRLLVKGIIINGSKCISLSVLPIGRSYTQKLWVSLKNESENSVNYRYIPFINLSFLKHICVFLYTFFYVLFWGIKDRNQKAIVCDVLCVSSSIAALLASKICGLKSVAVVTDIYNQMVGQQTSGVRSIISRLAGCLNSWYVSYFSKYVLLTEAMNEVVNPKGRPYIVMEALCDSNLADIEIIKYKKAYPKVILYAGGLEERYGLKMLVEAFKQVKLDNVELHIYGSGSYVNDLLIETANDSRIKYWGVRSNEEIVEAEYRATLLVNPRFSTEEFTKYSFPSKNMEYMVSGTPVLTTKLPGMPKEYYSYVLLIDDETIEGYVNAIEGSLGFSSDVLNDLGDKGRKFVLEKKNNVYQARRIVKLIKS